MSSIPPTPAPNVENELAKLANDAIAAGADPGDVSAKLRTAVMRLRANPELMQQATNALADGVATPADISRKVFEQAAHPVGINVEEPADLTEGTRAQLPGYMQPVPTFAQVGQNIKNLPQRALAALKRGGQRAGQDVTRAASNIPGFELGASAVRAKAQGEPYDQAYREVHDIVEHAPDPHLSDFAMSAALTPILPGSPAVAGALYGGASQLLSGEPGESATERGIRTAIGAGGGALLGKAGEAVVTGARAHLGKNFPEQKALMKDLADAANDQNYAGAQAAVAGRTPTPAVQRVLASPDFQLIEQDLRKSPQFRTMANTDPRFINEVYKTLSDEQGTTLKGLQPTQPNRPNSKRLALGDVKLLKEQLLSALETPDQKPPLMLELPAETHSVEPVVTELGHEQAFGHPMSGPLNTYASNETTNSQLVRDFPNTPKRQGPAGPAFNLKANPGHVQPGVSITTPRMRVQTAPAKPMPAYMPEYRGAVNQAAKSAGEIRAFRLGYNALRAMAGQHPVSERVADTFSPDAISRYVSKPGTTDLERARIDQGVLAALKDSKLFDRAQRIAGIPIYPRLSSQMKRALPLLRATGSPTQGMVDFLTKLGVVNAAEPIAK